MEDTLHKILNQLETLSKNISSIEMTQQEMKREQLEMKREQQEMRREQLGIKQEQIEMRRELIEMKCEQAEMRKEVAFYYGSMMKKLDETKTELSSEINQISIVQKQHQHVLEYLNQKQ